MKRTALGLLATVVLVVGAVVPASASRNSTGDWMAYTGTLTVESDLYDDALIDHVEVFTAPDGRFRVEVESGDGTGEQIAFDGSGVKTMLIRTPNGSYEAARVRAGSNFAVMSIAYAEDRGYEVLDAQDGRVTHWIKQTDHARVEFKIDTARSITADPARVTIDLPPGVELPDEIIELDESFAPGMPAATPGISGASRSLVHMFATGGASVTFVDFYYYQACVYAYNFRNNVSNFFTANSQRRNTCVLVDVSAWNRGISGAGLCTANWLAGGPTATYSSVTGYWDSYTPTDRMCSNHAGWDIDDIQVVPWSGLNSSIVG